MEKYGINLPVECWREALSAIEKTGFRYLLLKRLFKLSENELDKLKQAVDCSECVMFSVHSWEYLFLDTPFLFKATLERTKVVIDISKKLNVQNITFHTPMILDAELTQRQRGKLFMDFLTEIEAYIDDTSIKISIENVWDEEAEFRTSTEVLSFLEKSTLKQTGLCLDTGHLSILGLDCGEYINNIPAEYLQTTHIHDNDFLTDSHKLPGAGIIDWSLFFKAINKIKYSNPLVLEVISENTTTPAKDIARAWNVWQKICANNNINLYARQNISQEKIETLYGIKLHSLGDVPAAITVFEQIRNSCNSDLFKSQAIGWLGRCYEKIDEYSLAIDCYRSMLKIGGDNFTDSDGTFYISPQIALYRIAEILSKQGLRDDALVYYDEIIHKFAGTNHEKWSLIKKGVIFQEKFDDNKNALKQWRELEKINNNEIFNGILSCSLARLLRQSTG